MKLKVRDSTNYRLPGNKVMNWLAEDILASQKRICSIDLVTNSNDFFYDSGRKFPWWGANVWSTPSKEREGNDRKGSHLHSSCVLQVAD